MSCKGRDFREGIEGSVSLGLNPRYQGCSGDTGTSSRIWLSSEALLSNQVHTQLAAASV